MTRIIVGCTRAIVVRSIISPPNNTTTVAKPQYLAGAITGSQDDHTGSITAKSEVDHPRAIAEPQDRVRIARARIA